MGKGGRAKHILIMEGFTPLFGRIVNSSVWDEPDYIVKIFLTMLAVKDRDHVVRMNAYNLARMSRKTEAEVIEALKVLAAPDKRRLEPQPNEGRRIEKVEGGWLMLNGEFYQELMFAVMKRAKNAMAMREKRRQEKLGQAPRTAGQRQYELDDGAHGRDHADVNAGGDKGTTGPKPSLAEELAQDMALEIYEAYPRKVGKPAALLKIKKALKTVNPGVLLEKTRQYARAVNGTDPQFIPHPATWFNQERFNDHPQTWTRSEGARRPAANPGFNPNAQMAGADEDPYAVLGRSLGAPGADRTVSPSGLGGPPPDDSSLPAERDAAGPEGAAPGLPLHPVSDEPPPE